jgi:hypothetical protein
METQKLWEIDRLQYTSCFSRDYKRLDEDVDVKFDEEVQHVEEMAVKILVAAPGGAGPRGAAASLGGSGPLPLLLPWIWW